MELDKATYTTETDGGRAHTHVLRDLDEGVGHLGRVGAASLDADGRDLGAGGVEHGRGALHGVEGGGLTGGRYITQRSCQLALLPLRMTVSIAVPSTFIWVISGEVWLR